MLTVQIAVRDRDCCDVFGRYAEAVETAKQLMRCHRSGNRQTTLLGYPFVEVEDSVAVVEGAQSYTS